MFGEKGNSSRKPAFVTQPTRRFREEAIPRAALAHGITQSITFEYYAPFAGEVSVAGTFNNWNSFSHLLRKDSSGKWKLTLDLPLGRHEYRYVVDEEWTNEQRPMDAAPNPFGGYNNVIELR